MSIFENETFQWFNPGTLVPEENGFAIIALPHSDFFQDPTGGNGTRSNAPFYYTEITGDFTLRATVWHDFTAAGDACTLMAMDTPTLWAKACFEQTYFGAHTAVSVVTNGLSDDANGQNITTQTAITLQYARKGNTFAMHYSLDEKAFYMMRLFSLPMSQRIKVGFVAQSPAGYGGKMHFKDVFLAHCAPEDMRLGR